MTLSYSLQLPFPSPVFRSPRNTIEKRLGNLRTLHSSKEGGQQHTENDRSQDQVILLERYGNGTIKRFELFLRNMIQQATSSKDQIYLTQICLGYHKSSKNLSCLRVSLGLSRMITCNTCCYSFPQMLLDGSVTL